MLMKCKPTYQFQSIEFDYTVNNDEDIDKMFAKYTRVLKGLMEIAPIQEKQVVKEPLATDKQKDIMDRFGIKYTATTTAKEAQKLIQKSMNGD